MRTLKGEEGQALIETALSMTLFIVMMLGAVEFGRLAYVTIEVSNAAKSAAQYAGQSAATAADVSGIQTAAKNEYGTPASLTLVSPTANSGYACTCSGGTPPITTVSCTNNSLTDPTCATGSALELTVTIQTQVSFNPGMHVPGMPGPFLINGYAKQKVLQ